jgi:hypothetical protein
VSECTEEFLRRGLMAYGRPQPAPDPMPSILRSLQSRERAGRDRTFARRFYLLRAYWTIASVVSVWILWSVPWSAWYSA